MLFALALIPVIILLIVIYKNDRNDKEPIGLLIGLFFAGAATVISAIIAEALGDLVFDFIFPRESSFKAALYAVVIIGPAEELGKFFILWLITWKNKHFNYSYDAIVYAVFVSLGFAALENIGYVFSNGLGTAIIRMFTAIPGHASFAVFMGFFYSRAKYASITKEKGRCAFNMIFAIVLPSILHGIYDAIAMGAREANIDFLAGIAVIVWILFVIALFVMSIITVINSAKHDFCIVRLPDNTQTVYRPRVAGNWTCTCGTVNYLNFCSECGKQRPLNNTWRCPKCGMTGTFNFCGNCGCPKPSPETL